MNSETVTLIFSGIVTISTLVYAGLTWKLVNETSLMRKNTIEPYILVYLDIAETNPHIFYIKTKNIGQGVALDVKFEIKKEFSFKGVKKLKDIFYFSEGVKYFPPNKEDKHLLFSFSDSEAKSNLDDTLILKVKYKSILNENKETFYNLNIKELLNQGVLTPPGTYIGQISYRLEKIEKAISKLKENNNET